MSSRHQFDNAKIGRFGSISEKFTASVSPVSRHQFDNALSIKGDQSAKIVRISSQNCCTKMRLGIGANHTAKNWPRRLGETLHQKMRRMVRVGLTVHALPANVAPFESWAHQNQPAIHSQPMHNANRDHTARRSVTPQKRKVIE
jgi:hypothetical protein